VQALLERLARLSGEDVGFGPLPEASRQVAELVA
jgi:hypothetical protein